MKQTDFFRPIPDSIDGLIEAAVEILGEDDPIIQSMKTRKKWKQIKDEYKKLRKSGMASKTAVEQLHEKHYYSEKTIEAIIYSR